MSSLRMPNEVVVDLVTFVDNLIHQPFNNKPLYYTIVNEDQYEYLSAIFIKELRDNQPYIILRSITVVKDKRGKGLFKQFIQIVEEVCLSNNYNFIVDNIVNKQLAEWLSNNGYSILYDEHFKGDITAIRTIK